MKKPFRLPRRQLLFCAAFLSAFAALTLFLFTYHRDERLFENICIRLFREEMAADTLNMHYTIAYPDDFGIHNYEVQLPCYSSEGSIAGRAQRENLAALLKTVHIQKLSEEDRYAYELLSDSLDLSMAMSDYLYFEEPLAPSSGMQSQLPILLAEYTFRTEQDIKDYLRLLDQTDEYFASLLFFEQEKAEAGLLMASSSLEKVIRQCDTILDKASLAEETHFLQTTFQERLEPLLSQGVLTTDRAQKYIVLNNRLLRTVMQPAYEALADGLCLLQTDDTSPKGLAAYENGAEYYKLLLSSETGSARSVSELEDMLLAQLKAEYEQILNLLKEYPALADTGQTIAAEKAFPYRNAVQMLTDLKQRMQEDFPAFVNRSSLYSSAKHASSDQNGAAMPSVAVKAVSKNLQDYCAPAFYLTPPLDDTSQNVIYINEKNAPSSIELYTTLAHEGYPGHLYQSVFYNGFQDNSAASQVRQLLWYGGYLEGWALYVEFISFDYASEILSEREEELAAAAVQLEKHNRSMQLCLYSLIDILIHYENTSAEQIARLLDSFGINGDAAPLIYEYIAEAPANYPKYYVGYLEILALQKQAMEKWQDNYTDYAFHTFFLECGPSGFARLQERLADATPLP